MMIAATEKLAASTKTYFPEEENYFANRKFIRSAEELADYFLPPNLRDTSDVRSPLDTVRREVVKFLRSLGLHDPDLIMEVINQTIAACVKKLARLSEGDEGLSKTYIFSILKHKKSDLFRDQPITVELIDAVDWMGADRLEDSLIFWNALNALEDGERAILVLFYMYQLSIKDIIAELIKFHEVQLATFNSDFEKCLYVLLHQFRVITESSVESKQIRARTNLLINLRDEGFDLSRFNVDHLLASFDKAAAEKEENERVRREAEAEKARVAAETQARIKEEKMKIRAEKKEAKASEIAGIRARNKALRAQRAAQKKGKGERVPVFELTRVEPAQYELA